MTDEERDIITRFIERVSGATQTAPSPRSVPTTIAALPPIDPDADRLIADLFQRYPQARYRLTQTAFVQEHALAEAHSRISQLQAALQQQPQQPAPGGFFHNVFGGSGPAAPQPQPYQPYPPTQPYVQPPQQYAPPPPQYAAQPGMFTRSGSGFLGSALTTAAGVAGGMVAGNALMNLFEGPRGYGGGFGGGGFGGGGGPWDNQAPPDAQVTGSAWDNATENAQPAGWDQGGTDTSQGGDSGGDSGGGWDNSGTNSGTF